jgi:YD repeat-containing protein
VGAGLALAALLTASGSLAAQVNESFAYDELGRLIQVTHGDGSTVDHVFDAAGNRLTVVGSKKPVDPDPPVDPPKPVAFERTLALSPTSGQTVDLRAVANAAGYNGQQPAKIIFDVPAGVSIIAAPGGVAMVSGEWPTGTYAIDIALKVSGQVYGGGGTGGNGAGGETPAAGAGITGGDAFVAQAPLSIEVLPGGTIAGGGGGGGGGAQSPRLDMIIGPKPGGGGGGGFPNGAGGASSAPTVNSGLPGTAAGGGAGGISIPAGPSGKGGNGGAAGSPGEAGQATTSTESSAGAGGAPGFAVRKNGHAVTVTNAGGSITGAQE